LRIGYWRPRPPETSGPSLSQPVSEGVLNAKLLAAVFPWPLRLALAVALAGVVLCGWVPAAAARPVIKQPDLHPQYDWAAEGLLVAGFANPPGLVEARGDAVDEGIGLGLRLTIPILDRGFLPKVNDTVGIGFGAEWVSYSDDNTARGFCTHYVDGPNNTRVCTEVNGDGSASYLFLPVVMQWNFWFHRRWSVFGEPGLALYFSRPGHDETDFGFTPVVIVGGRWHITDKLHLSLRLAYPTSSLGLAWLF
jgi:hypothetical protein